MKKILLSILCVFLCFSVISEKVWADETEEEIELTNEGNAPESSEESELDGTAVPGDAEIDIGEDFYHVILESEDDLTLETISTEDATYQWYKDDVIITGATNGSYTLSSADKANVDHYTLKCVATYTISDQEYYVEDSTEIWVTEELTLNITNDDDVLTAHPDAAVPDGTEKQYFWYKDGQSLGEGVYTYTLTEADKSTIGITNYSCQVVYPDFGEVINADIDVLVRPSNKAETTDTVSLSTSNIAELNAKGYKYELHNGKAYLYLDGFYSSAADTAFDWYYVEGISERHIILTNNNYIEGSFQFYGNGSDASIPVIIEGSGNLIIGAVNKSANFKQGASDQQLGDLTIKDSASLTISGSNADGLLRAKNIHIYNTASINLRNADIDNNIIYLKESNSEYSESHGYVYNNGQFVNSNSETVDSITLLSPDHYITITEESPGSLGMMDAGDTYEIKYILDAHGYNGVTYQWYACKTDQKYESEEIASATSSSYNFMPSEAGIYSFYCVAIVDGSNKWESGVKTAIVSDENHIVLNSDISISYYQASAGNLETDGWHWDSENNKLTLANIVSKNHKVEISRPSAFTVEFVGSNYFYNSNIGDKLFYFNGVATIRSIDGGSLEVIDKRATYSMFFSSTTTFDNARISIYNTVRNSYAIYNSTYMQTSVANQSNLHLYGHTGFYCKYFTMEDSGLYIRAKYRGIEILGTDTSDEFNIKSSHIDIKTTNEYSVAFYCQSNNNLSFGSITDSIVILKGVDNGMKIEFINTDNRIVISNCDLRLEADQSQALYSNCVDEFKLINSSLNLRRNGDGAVAYLGTTNDKKAEKIISLKATSIENNVRFNDCRIFSNNTELPNIASFRATNEAYLTFDAQPNDRSIYTNSVNGNENITVSASAHLTNGKAKKGITYKWYEALDTACHVANKNPDTDRLVYTGSIFAVPNNQRGCHYYYCVASCTVGKANVSETGNVFAVVTAAQGKQALVNRVNLNSDVNALDTYGYKWENITGNNYRLTLNDVEAYIPFSRNSDTYNIFDGLTNKNVTIQLVDGSVNNLFTAACVFSAGGSSSYTWTITGNGRLNMGQYLSFWSPQQYLNLIITGNAEVHLTQGVGNIEVKNGAKLYAETLQVGSYSYSRNLVVNGGEVYCRRLYAYGNVSLDNALLKIETDASSETSDIRGSLVMNDSEMIVKQASGTLEILDSVILSGSSRLDMVSRLRIKGNNKVFAIGSDAFARIVSSYIGVHFDNNSGGSINAEGTLAVSSGNGEKITNGTLTIGENANISYPTNVTKANINTWISEANPEEANNQILISGSSITINPITSASITGTVRAGETLTVSSLVPSDATVTYQWMYSEDGINYHEISGEYSNRYIIKSRYTDCYIACKVNGVLFNSGELLVRANGKVQGNPYEFKAVYVDNILQSKDGDSSLDYGIFSINTNGFTSNIVVEKNSDDAVVSIINLTTHQTYNGNVATVGLATGTNIMEIHYVYKNIEKVYVFYIERYSPRTLLQYIPQQEGVLVIAEYTDGNGEWVQETTEEGAILASALEGTEVYLEAEVTKAGYTFNMDELEKLGYVASVQEDGSIHIIRQYMAYDVHNIYINESKYFKLNKPNASVYWNNNSTDGLHLYVEWDFEPENFKNFGDNRLCAKLYELDKKGKVTGGNILSDSYTLSYKIHDGFSSVEYSDIYSGIIGDHLNSNKKYELHLYYECNGGAKSEDQVIVLDASKTTASIELEEHNITVIRDENLQDIEVAVNTNNICQKDKEYLYLVTSDADKMLGTQSSTKDYALIENDALHIHMQPTGTSSVEGMVYLTVAYADHNGKVAADTIAVNMVNETSNANSSLRLKETSGKFNLFSTSEVNIPLNITGNDKVGITSAEIVKATAGSTLSDKAYKNADTYLRLEVKDDRTLTVKAIVPGPNPNYDWATYYKNFSGNFEFYIKLTLTNGNTCYSTSSYKLNVANKAPTVKTTTVKLNSFYFHDTANMGFTINGETVVDIMPDFYREGFPMWLRFPYFKTFILINDMLPESGKANIKVPLLIYCENYDAPIMITVPVVVSNTAFKVKAQTTSISVIETRNNSSFNVNFAINGKNVDYSKSEYKVSLVTAAEIAAMSSKEKSKYTIQNDFEVESGTYNKKTGVYTLTLSEKNLATAMKAGTLLFKVETQRGDFIANVPVSVKLLAANKTTFSSTVKEVKLNSYLGSGNDAQKVGFKSNIVNFSLDDVTYNVFDATDKSNPINSELYISKESDGFSIHSNLSTEDSRKYVVIFTHTPTGKRVSVPVSIVNIAPAIKTNKTSLTINSTDESGQTITLTSAIKGLNLGDTIGYGAGEFIVEMTAPDGTIKENDKIDEIGLDLEMEDTGKGTVLRFTPNSHLQKGVYNAEIRYRYLHKTGSADSAVVKVKITATDKQPNFKFSKSTVTLNKDMGRYVDKVKVYISNYSLLTYGSFNVIASAGASELDLVISDSTFNTDGGIELFLSNKDMPYGSTYKLEFTPYYGVYGTEGKKITMTVKVAASDKKSSMTNFDFALKASGSIDLTRASSSSIAINQTYTNWFGAADSNAPTMTWKVIARKGKDLYNEHGIVDGDVTAWFKDIDPSYYGLKIALDDSTPAFNAGYVSSSLKYTLKVTYTTNESSAYGEKDFIKEVALSVKQGSAKFKTDKSAITLSKYDGKDKVIVLLTKADKDSINVNDIVDVKLTSTFFSRQIAANLDCLITEAKDGSIYLVIGYKDGVNPLNVKSGSVKLEVYLKGNTTNKANGSVTLKINVK